MACCLPGTAASGAPAGEPVRARQPLRRPRQPTKPSGRTSAAGRDRPADGRGRAEPSPGQDPNCLLQGHLVHVPEVHISPPARAEQAEGREFHIVPARDEPGEAGRERTGGPSLAAAPAAKRHSGDLAEAINAIVLGWMTYWGRFYRTEMIPLLKRINTYLMRWARKEVQAAAWVQTAEGVVDQGDATRSRSHPTGW